MAKSKIAKTQKKPEIKRKNEIYKIIVSCVLILLFVLLLCLVLKEFFAKENGNNGGLSDENFSFYDSETCRCIERDRLRCNEGFELDSKNKLCRSADGKEVTNVILACSKYECSGFVYEFNFENQAWEMK